MNRNDIIKILEPLHADIESIMDSKVQSIQKKQYDLIENLASENETLQKEIKQLKDEVNRLKGEQGVPKFSKKKYKQDFSSEKDRNTGGSEEKKKNKRKKDDIKIDREITLDVNPSDLPDDAVFKYYAENVVQDIIIKTDNVKFKKAVYYSPSMKKTYTAKVPPGYEGEFGPNIKTLCLALSHDTLVSQPALRRWFETFAISISAASISRLSTDGKNIEALHQEKEDIVDAGLQSTSYQQIDDTSSKVNGKNHYTHILCNPFYTAYITMPKKSRLTVLYILSQGDLRFRLNDEAYELMKILNLPSKWIDALKQQSTQQCYTKKELNHLIRKLYPNPKKYKNHRKIIIEAAAIAGYHEKETNVKTLVCDDAPQFKLLLDIGLCWIHEGRHYKKLNPVTPPKRKMLEAFQKQFWDYYRKLLDYKKSPNQEQQKKMTDEFDVIFSPKPDYEELNACIKRSIEKKESLLLVLKRPIIPPHNNEPELGARAVKRKGDVSLQTKNKKGTKAKDTMMTIVQTARKLQVNGFKYLYDRITKKYEMPSLADLIKTKSAGNILAGDST